MIALAMVLSLTLQDGAREWVERLRSDSLEERDDAAARLRKLGRAAIPELEKAARDADGDFATRAKGVIEAIRVAESLSKTLRKAFPAVEERLATPDDAVWTRTFLAATARDGDWKRLHPELKAADVDVLAVRAIKGASGEEQQREVFQRVGAFRLLSATPTVVDLLKHGNGTLRALAARTLGEMRARDSARAIVALLTDEHSGVRVEAAIALGFTSDSIERLAPALTDTSPAVRMNAAAAVAEIGGAGAVDRLAPLLKDADLGVRVCAAQAMCRLGSRDGIDLILDKVGAQWDVTTQIENTFTIWTENVGVTSIGAAAEPALWKRLRESNLAEDFSGTLQALLELLGKTAKFKLDLPADEAWLSQTINVPANTSFSTALDRLTWFGGHEPVLCSDGISIMKTDDAVEHWRKWRAATRK